jgi:hypothetical protein
VVGLALLRHTTFHTCELHTRSAAACLRRCVPRGATKRTSRRAARASPSLSRNVVVEDEEPSARRIAHVGIAAAVRRHAVGTARRGDVADLTELAA